MDIDLSSLVILNGSASLVDGRLVSTDVSGEMNFLVPFEFDPAGTYEVGLDLVMVDGSATTYDTFVLSALGPTSGEYDASVGYELAADSPDGLAPGTRHTPTFTVGPGVGGWDAAAAAGEMTPRFYVQWADVIGVTITLLDPARGALDLALEAGHTFGTQLLGDTYSISVRRGLRSSGVTDDLDPATFTAVIKGGEAVNPATNDDVRPERPVRLRASADAGATWVTLWTGKIQRSRVEYDKADAQDPNAYRLHLTGTDLVVALARHPSETAVDGNLAQRVAALMDPTGLPYTVDDPSTPKPPAPVPTDARDVLGQLRLIRDTDHAVMYVDRDGVLAVVSDNARARVVAAPDWIATDQSAVQGIYYTQITPALDTDAVVNLITVKLLDGAGNPEYLFTDEESRAAWGDHPQSVTVNGGVPEGHADLWFASRVDPELLPERVDFIVQERLPTSRAPEGRGPHLAAALGVELYDVVRVTRAGIPTADLLVREIAHTITPRRWSVELGLRVPEVLATRWDDVPAGIRWDDVPAGLTWSESVKWHPYEGA